MLQAEDELEDLATEYKLLKKLKRGKMSEHDFDVATGLTSDEDSERGAGPAKPQGQQGAAGELEANGQQGGEASEQGGPDRGAAQQPQQNGKHKRQKLAAGPQQPVSASHTLPASRPRQSEPGHQPPGGARQAQGGAAQQGIAQEGTAQQGTAQQPSSMAGSGAPTQGARLLEAADGGLHLKSAKLRGHAPTRVQQHTDSKQKRKNRRDKGKVKH